MLVNIPSLAESSQANLANRIYTSLMQVQRHPHPVRQALPYFKTEI